MDVCALRVGGKRLAVGRYRVDLLDGFFGMSPFRTANCQPPTAYRQRAKRYGIIASMASPSTMLRPCSMK
jgi:hypothetical protein